MQDVHPPRVTILDARRAERRRRRVRWMTTAVLMACISGIIMTVRMDSSQTPADVDPDDLPVGPPVPELAATGWINSPPLTSDALAGKVVVYDFWTYSCVNCVRAIPHLRAWYERYQDDGLEIVGVHSPEFGFEKTRENVIDAVDRLGITWPVAVDDENNIWNAFQNRAWPSKYVTDRTGSLRYLNVGEGRYRETESVLRHLLGVKPESPRAGRAAGGGPDDPADNITPETHLGTQRGEVARAGRHDYELPSGPPDLGAVSLSGIWEADAERARSGAEGATLTLSYRAREVNLVMATAGDPVDVVVELNGHPIPEGLRTDDVQVTTDGSTYVRVTEPGLYRLASGTSVARHVLRLVARAPGLDAFAFTFG